jgi:hypothetical protein
MSSLFFLITLTALYVLAFNVEAILNFIRRKGHKLVHVFVRDLRRGRFVRHH